MTAIAVIEEPAQAVALADVKQHLRLAGNDQDDLLTLYIAVAQGEIDGPPGWLGRSIGKQTLELQGYEATDCDGWIRLRYPPVRDIVSITYGASVVVDPGTYVFGPGDVVRPTFGSAWPWAAAEQSTVRVRYEAGYDPVPAPLKAAILLMVQDLYLLGSRDPALTTDTVFGVQSLQYAASPAPVLSQAAERLLRPYRVWSL